MYILIDVKQIENSTIHTTKQTILTQLNVNRGTLNKAISQGNIINNHLVIDNEPIKCNKKGNIFL